MRMIALWMAFAALALLQGCAFTNATLPVAHDAALNTQGPITEVGPLQFTPPDLVDGRMDKARIGWKQNGYGANTADIYTSEPVDVIVENALTDALADNKHGIAADGRVRITGTIDRFWFETDQNFWSVNFIGDVQCTLDFVDTRTSKSIYSSSYSGNYNHKSGGGLEKTWTMVMGKAIDNLIEDIVLDSDLAEALKGLQ